MTVAPHSSTKQATTHKRPTADRQRLLMMQSIYARPRMRTVEWLSWRLFNHHLARAQDAIEWLARGGYLAERRLINGHHFALSSHGIACIEAGRVLPPLKALTPARAPDPPPLMRAIIEDPTMPEPAPKTKSKGPSAAVRQKALETRRANAVQRLRDDVHQLCAEVAAAPGGTPASYNRGRLNSTRFSKAIKAAIEQGRLEMPNGRRGGIVVAGSSPPTAAPVPSPKPTRQARTALARSVDADALVERVRTTTPSVSASRHGEALGWSTGRTYRARDVALDRGDIWQLGSTKRTRRLVIATSEGEEVPEQRSAPPAPEVSDPPPVSEPVITEEPKPETHPEVALHIDEPEPSCDHRDWQGRCLLPSGHDGDHDPHLGSTAPASVLAWTDEDEALARRRLDRALDKRRELAVQFTSWTAEAEALDRIINRRSWT